MTKKRKSSGSLRLIIFTRNPQLGIGKTRIANTVGIHQALEISEQLISCTQRIVQPLAVSPCVYYSDYIDGSDGWYFAEDKCLQDQADNLGQRMTMAIQHELISYERVVIIGTDCPYLTSHHISQAHEQLDQNKDAVIGPAIDGGFYLLALKRFENEIFREIQWSTDQVIAQLKSNFNQLTWNFGELEALQDVDEYQDWKDYIQA